MDLQMKIRTSIY